MRCPLDILTVRGSCSHLRSAPCGKHPGVGPMETSLGWAATELQLNWVAGGEAYQIIDALLHLSGRVRGRIGEVLHHELGRRCALPLGRRCISLNNPGERPKKIRMGSVHGATETLLTADFFRDELHGEEQWKFMAAQERKMPERKSDLLPLVMVSTDWRTLPDSVAFVGSVVLVCFSLAAGDRSFALVSRTMPGEVMDSTSRARLPLDAAASSLPNCSKKATRERTDIANTTHKRQSCRSCQSGVELVDWIQSMRH